MTTARDRSAPNVVAVDAADAGDHAVGRRVADQVVELAPAALRRERERAVLDEAAGVAEIGDVLARGAQAEGVALGDGVGPAGVGEQRLARAQLEQVGAQGVRVGVAARVPSAVGADGGGRAQRRQHRSRLDDVADVVAQRFDHAVARRMDLVLHLHRLDDGDERAANDARADLDGQRDDAAGERGNDLDGRHAGAAQPARTASR